KQRVVIARALASRPQVLLSDEATPALDPETTRAILALLRLINQELNLTLLLITHRMQNYNQVARWLAIMEEGQAVDMDDTLHVFSRPAHAVTQSLLDEVVPRELPPQVLERVRALLGTGPVGDTAQQASSLWRLVIAGQGSERPLLSELVRGYGLDLNIVHG